MSAAVLTHQGQFHQRPDRAVRTQGSVRLLHRICRGYAVVGMSVPAFGVGTAQVMGVMGGAWLIASMALTVVAAILLGVAVLGTQGNVINQLDKSDTTPTAKESLIARLPRLSMITGLFALAWLIVGLSHRSEPRRSCPRRGLLRVLSRAASGARPRGLHLRPSKDPAGP
ncbi:hypothetical protein [Streptomyces sp. NPDC004270]